MSTWREKLLGHDDSPNRRRGLTYRLAGGVFGSVLRAKATITNFMGFRDERQSPSRKQEDLENGLSEQDFRTSPGHHFGDSPSRYPNLPKRRSIFEHDPWSSGPERPDATKGAFTSSIGRRRRDRVQADLCQDALTERFGKETDDSHLEAGKASQSSPVNILPRRLPSPGLLSLIELERKEWLLDGHRRPEQILKPEHFRRLKSDVDVLTEPKPAEIRWSSKQPKLSVPMPGTNLPLFSPNEDSFQTVTTFPGDYFGQEIPRTVHTPKLLPSAKKTFSERITSSETLVAANEAERRNSESDNGSSASRKDSAVVISGEMLRLYDELAEDDPISHEETINTACQPRGTVPPPKLDSEQTQDRDLTGLSDAPSNQTIAHTEHENLQRTGSTQQGPMPAEHPPKAELCRISGQIDGFSPLQLDEPAMSLLSEEGYNMGTNVDLNASQPPIPLESGPMKENSAGSPQRAANDKKGDGGSSFTTPNNSPFDSPTMGSTGMFKRVRAERLRRYQELVAGPAKLSTESSPVSLKPALSTIQTADTSLSGLPSSSIRTSDKGTNPKAFRGSIKRTVQHDTPVKLHRGGKRSREFREWSMSPNPASDAAVEGGLGSPTSSQPYISISGLPQSVTVPAFEFDLPLRLRQVTPITIIRLDDLDFEDINRPFVAARLPWFGPPTPEHDSERKTAARSRSPSSPLGEPSTPELYSQFSPHSSDIATPDGTENTSPCPVRQPSPVPWKLDVMHRSKLTSKGGNSNPGRSVSRVKLSELPQTPNRLDRVNLPSVREWLKSHNFLKNAKGLEEVGWAELLAIDNKGLMRRDVGTYTVRKKMLKELSMIKADHANAYRKMGG